MADKKDDKKQDSAPAPRPYDQGNTAQFSNNSEGDVYRGAETLDDDED